MPIFLSLLEEVGVDDDDLSSPPAAAPSLIDDGPRRSMFNINNAALASWSIMLSFARKMGLATML